MSNDSNLFRTREQLTEEGWTLEGNMYTKDEERYLPLYEAKLFHQYDHRFATFEGVDEKARRGGNAREMTPVEKGDPETVVVPRYWVPEEEVAKRLARREGGEDEEEEGLDKREGISNTIPAPRTPHPALDRLAELARRSLFARLPERPTSERESSP